MAAGGACSLAGPSAPSASRLRAAVAASGACSASSPLGAIGVRPGRGGPAVAGGLLVGAGRLLVGAGRLLVAAGEALADLLLGEPLEVKRARRRLRPGVRRRREALDEAGHAVGARPAEDDQDDQGGGDEADPDELDGADAAEPASARQPRHLAVARAVPRLPHARSRPRARCWWQGICCRTSASCPRSISATATPSPPSTSASTVPHGSTMSEWP